MKNVLRCLALIGFVGLLGGCGEGVGSVDESVLEDRGDADGGANEGISDRRGSIGGTGGIGGVCASPPCGSTCQSACENQRVACHARNNESGPDDTMEPCEMYYRQCMNRCALHPW
jgi:hypothetical protein